MIESLIEMRKAPNKATTISMELLRRIVTKYKVTSLYTKCMTDREWVPLSVGDIRAIQQKLPTNLGGRPRIEEEYDENWSPEQKIRYRNRMYKRAQRERDARRLRRMK